MVELDIIAQVLLFGVIVMFKLVYIEGGSVSRVEIIKNAFEFKAF